MVLTDTFNSPWTTDRGLRTQPSWGPRTPSPRSRRRGRSRRTRRSSQRGARPCRPDNICPSTIMCFMILCYSAYNDNQVHQHHGKLSRRLIFLEILRILTYFFIQSVMFCFQLHVYLAVQQRSRWLGPGIFAEIAKSRHYRLKIQRVRFFILKKERLVPDTFIKPLFERNLGSYIKEGVIFRNIFVDVLSTTSSHGVGQSPRNSINKIFAVIRKSWATRTSWTNEARITRVWSSPMTR